MGIPVIGELIDGVKDLLSEVVVDRDKKIQVSLELAKLEDQALARLDAQALAQIEVNQVEAASGSVFVAGWRPAIGWVGAIALLYSTVLFPLMNWAALILGYKGAFPVLDSDLILYIVGGMLGIGGMRSFEKVKGVSTNDYRDVPTRVDTKKEEAVTPPPKKKPRIHFKL